jgi:sulfide:quinone oxidoreductase
MKSHYQVLIIGGGTAGIMTAAQMRRKDRSLDIAIIEPAEYHFYQPAWTLVGAGTFDYGKTRKPMGDLIPKGVTWIKDYATGFDPKNNSLKTKENGAIGYDYLVVAPGLVVDTSLIEGLTEALGKGNVCSIYTDPEHTWEVIRNLKEGNAIFTQPTTPIKCGGAPQKIAYLASHHFKKRGVADKINVTFATPGSVIFGVKPVRETLEKVLDRYNMTFKAFHAPFKIDGDKQIAYFKHKMEDGTEEVVEMKYDMFHLAPPQAAPEFVRKSELANEGGWLKVDKHSLQHLDYPNIFGLGDVAGLPTAKTGAAIRKQVPVVVDNILQLIDHQKKGDKSYNGYSSCPLVTAYGKMVLAEFDYDGNFIPDPKLKQMLVFDSSKEHWRLWMLKKYGLPYLYWNKMMKGKEV